MKKILAALLLFLCCANIAAAAEPKLDYGQFGLLPVLHEGRIKPLDSFARIMLREFSGRDAVHGHGATEWLAEVVFDPAGATETPIFEITNPAVREHFGLNKKKTLFSFSELAPGLAAHAAETQGLRDADPEKLTAQQQAVLRLYDDVAIYSDLLRSFSAVLPLGIDAPSAYGTGKAYIDFRTHEDEIQKNAAKLVRKKGTDPAKYSDDEKKLAAFAFALQEIETAGANNSTLKIINKDGDFLSPWQSLLQNGDLKIWHNMATAYRTDDAEGWRAATETARGQTPFKIHLEKAYNVIAPFPAAMGFYLLGIIILAAELYRKSRRMLFPLLCLGSGLALHIGGIATRIIILNRPPVGTLYESLLFVSLICAGTALALYLRRKNLVALFAGQGTAAFLLFLAPFLLQRGESMEMLVAVLNTSFWLGTHVLCITAGYGISILAATFAHAWFIMRLKNAPAQQLGLLYDSIYKTTLAALLLTCIGTILGGIWADQSWGRFWGWDPKENGALLIVLWLIWIQHGRIAGRLSRFAFLAAVAFLNVIVAIAWFGVNLLGIGLHSYGFITGIALALALFCAGEILLIAILWKLNAEKTRHALV
jgi:ABC-type transport system involved in cytochrome c biogenesis permease subunit